MTTGISVLPTSLSYLNPHVMNDMIHVGKKGDGGYVLPSSVVGQVDAVVSFGVGWDWSFEESLARIPRLKNVSIQAYDHTVGSEAYLLNAFKGVLGFLAGRNSRKDVTARLAEYLDYRRFFSGRHIHYRERVWDFARNRTDVTVETAFHRLLNAGHVLLKVDIDGAEYRVISDILKYSDRIDLMLFEFHGTWHLRSIFEMHVRNILAYFNIVHIHGNNYGGIAADGLPDALEITFANKRFPTTGALRNHLPIPGLDFPNVPSRPEVVMDFH